MISAPGPFSDGREGTTCFLRAALEQYPIHNHMHTSPHSYITYQIPLHGPWLFLINPVSVLQFEYSVILMRQPPAPNLSSGPTMHRVLARFIFAVTKIDSKNIFKTIYSYCTVREKHTCLIHILLVHKLKVVVHNSDVCSVNCVE